MSRKFYIENDEAIPAIQYVETQPTGFSLITDENTLKELYVKKYNTREVDGQNYFNDFRANLMLDIINSVYSPQEIFVLENHLKNLIEELITGNWLTAQNTNLTLALEGIYTQIMKDEIQLYINDYITNNY